MQLHVCILSMFFPIFKDKSKLSALKNLKFQILWTFSMSEKVSKPHSFQCTLQPLISDVSCFYDVINSYRCIFLQLDPFWCWLKSTLIFIWKCPVSYDFSFSWSQSWLKCLTTGQQTMGTVMGLTDRWLVCLNTLSKVAHVFKRPHNASTTLYFLLPFFFFCVSLKTDSLFINVRFFKHSSSICMYHRSQDSCFFLEKYSCCISAVNIFLYHLQR